MSLHSEGVADSLPQHLEPAADADDRPPGPVQVQDFIGIALSLQKQKIVDRILRPGEDHGIRLTDFLTGMDVPEMDCGFVFQWVEVGEVGDMGKVEDGDLQRPISFRDIYFIQGHSILLRHVEVFQEGNDPQHRDSGFFLQEFQPGSQETQVSPEFIDDKPLNAFSLFLAQKFKGPHQGSEDPSFVNISHEKNRGIGYFSHAHVGDIPIPQVDLRRASGSFDDDHLIFLRDPPVTLPHCPDRFFLEAMVYGGIHIAEDFPLNDHLGPGIRIGFEEHRVHVHVGLQAGGLCLDHLGPPHLSSVRSDEGVQGHVLGLERGHAEAVLPEHPAHSGHDHALAHKRPGPLDHQRFSVHISIFRDTDSHR